MDANPTPELMQLTANIVSAHACRNEMPPSELPGLIRSVYQALELAGNVASQPEAAAGPPEPAVPVRKSVFPDYIVCLEDGKKLRMLKRHLATAYDMTPDQYRAKWGLPSTYPMVAPNYTATRSALAKQFGLGRKSVSLPAEPEVQKIPEGTSSRNQKRKKAL